MRVREYMAGAVRLRLAALNHAEMGRTMRNRSFVESISARSFVESISASLLFDCLSRYWAAPEIIYHSRLGVMVYFYLKYNDYDGVSYSMFAAEAATFMGMLDEVEVGAGRTNWQKEGF
jgi:hypothetical protein